MLGYHDRYHAQIPTEHLKPRFNIRTLLALTVVCASVVVLCLPFSPSLAFSQPVLIGSSENDHGYVFDEYEITVTNNSFYSIWYRGNGHGDVTTFWREQAPATPESTTAATHASPFSIVALHRGGKAKISTHIARDWGAFRVQFEVFDWRNRSAWCRSGSLRTADHPR